LRDFQNEIMRKLQVKTMENIYYQIMSGLLDQIIMDLIHQLYEEFFSVDCRVDVVITSCCKVSVWL
jgi:hypothetical protein